MMLNRLKYHLIDESPWPFLVSTVSLFLTLGAVMFFYIFIQGLDLLYLGDNVTMCMISFTSIKNKITENLRSSFMTVVFGTGGYSGLTLNKNYSSLNNDNIVLYGNVKVCTKDYSSASIKLLQELSLAYDRRDIKSIYRCWGIALCNEKGELNHNYGKFNNAINSMTNHYNKSNNKEFNVNEKDFLLHTKGYFDPKTLGIISYDQYNNLVETITMDIANIKSRGAIEYVRNFDPELDYATNLSGQTNADCIGFLWYNIENQSLQFVFVDCKKTDMHSLQLKLQQQYNNGNIVEPQYITGSRAKFGCNLYLVATSKDQKDVILTQQEKQVVSDFIDKMALINPSFFTEYQNSPEFKNFQETGKLNVFASSKYPVPKAFTSYDVQKYLRPFNPVDTQEYAKLMNDYDKENINRDPLIFDTEKNNPDDI